MKKYYRERFESQRRLQKKIAPLMEVNDILETLRGELRDLIPSSMEGCILLLDPEAGKYTRPLQCALYDRPVNCQVCKRNRPAIQKAKDGSWSSYTVNMGGMDETLLLGGIDNKSLFDGCGFQPAVERKDRQSLSIFLDAYQGRCQLTCIGSP